MRIGYNALIYLRAVVTYLHLSICNLLQNVEIDTQSMCKSSKKI